MLWRLEFIFNKDALYLTESALIKNILMKLTITIDNTHIFFQFLIRDVMKIKMSGI